MRRTRSGEKGSRARWRARVREDFGQSLILITLAMGVIMAIAAFAIDVAQWEVAHHKAQVTADATALAAANCLADLACASNAAAETKSEAVAAANGYSNLTDANYTFTSSTVKVTLKGSSSSAFAGMFGFALEPVSGAAVASYSTIPKEKFQCASAGTANCLSLFAGNSSCPSPALTKQSTSTVGLSFNSNGGGSANIYDAYSNGLVFNAADSKGNWTLSAPACQYDYPTPPGDKSTSLTTTSTGILPYPAVWTQPTCDAAHKAATWDAASITAAGGAGTYCVTTGPTNGCKDGADETGDIYLDMSSLPSGAYEFVGPCVDISGQNSSVTNISGQPFVYGTSNIVTKASSTALPACTSAANNGTSGTSTYIDGNNVALDAPVYDQCGTVEITGNQVAFAGYIEAWNIISDKNSGTVTGDGPTSPTGGGVTYQPGGDTLTG